LFAAGICQRERQFLQSIAASRLKYVEVRYRRKCQGDDSNTAFSKSSDSAVKIDNARVGSHGD
jgi:hypothetical protein